MNVIKEGYFDDRGMPMDWWIDADKSDKPKSVFIELDDKGKVYVEGVEVKQWSDTKTAERIATLASDEKLKEIYKVKEPKVG